MSTDRHNSNLASIRRIMRSVARRGLIRVRSESGALRAFSPASYADLVLCDGEASHVTNSPSANQDTLFSTRTIGASDELAPIEVDRANGLAQGEGSTLRSRSDDGSSAASSFNDGDVAFIDAELPTFVHDMLRTRSGSIPSRRACPSQHDGARSRASSFLVAGGEVLMSEPFCIAPPTGSFTIGRKPR